MIAAPVPQHLVLVLAATGEFDSRSYRIARACVGRGHPVTLVARWREGLPLEEEHPLGFRLLRVRATPEDGIPSGRIVELPEADWQAWRDRCLSAAHGAYNWETQVERLLDPYTASTGARW